MSGSLIIFLIGVGCILAGLFIVTRAGNAGNPLLAAVVWWIGLVLIVFGAVLILTPVLIWFNKQLREMLGVT